VVELLLPLSKQRLVLLHVRFPPQLHLLHALLSLRCKLPLGVVGLIAETLDDGCYLFVALFDCLFSEPPLELLHVLALPPEHLSLPFLALDAKPLLLKLQLSSMPSLRLLELPLILRALFG